MTAPWYLFLLSVTACEIVFLNGHLSYIEKLIQKLLFMTSNIYYFYILSSFLKC